LSARALSVTAMVADGFIRDSALARKATGTSVDSGLPISGARLVPGTGRNGKRKPQEMAAL
jgi:hypothetical protein